MLRMYQKINGNLGRVTSNGIRRLYQKVNDTLQPVQSLWRKMEDGSLEEIDLDTSGSMIEFTEEECLSLDTQEKAVAMFRAKFAGRLVTDNLDDSELMYSEGDGFCLYYGTTDSSNVVMPTLFSFTGNKITQIVVTIGKSEYVYTARIYFGFSKNGSFNDENIIWFLEKGGAWKSIKEYKCAKSVIQTHAFPVNNVTITRNDFTCLSSGRQTYYFTQPKTSAGGNKINPLYVKYLKIEFEE